MRMPEKHLEDSEVKPEYQGSLLALVHACVSSLHKHAEMASEQLSSTSQREQQDTMLIKA